MQTSQDSGPHQSSTSQEIGTWQNPSKGGWGLSSGQNKDIIVDSRDREAWPSIGDKSETTSEAGSMDNASVTSGSVISSSSNPGHGQDSSGQGSSAIPQSQGQGASSNIWGSDEKTDSSSAWGSNPASTGGSAWGSSLPNTSTAGSGANFRMNMQSNPGSGSSNLGSSSELGWGMNNATLAGSANVSLPSSVQGQGGSSTNSGMFSGAQMDNIGRAVSSGNTSGQPGSVANNNSMWQGISNISSGGPDRATNPPTGWGAVSSGNSVMAQSLSISNANGGNAIDSKANSSDQWGRNQPGVSDWGKPDDVVAKAQSGWGSPASSPIQNAGTEAWGQPTKQTPAAWGTQPQQQPQQQPPQQQPPAATPSNSWEQPKSNPNPDQSNWATQRPANQNPSPGWGDQPTQQRPNSTGWGQPDDKRPANASSWGQADDKGAQRPPPSTSSGWGQQPPTPEDRAAPSAWGAPGEKPAAAAPQNQWGMQTAGASGPPNPANQPPPNPANQPPPNPANQPPPNPQQQQTNPQAAWGSGNPAINAKPAAPPQQQPPPSTWAQAAGRGLPSTNNQNPANPNTAGPPGSRMPTRDDIIAQVVNNNDGWGKTPIRQDTSWDKKEAMQVQKPPSMPPVPSSVGPGGGAETENSNHWHQPNNGTAIWEATKESSSAWGGASGGSTGSTGSNEWDKGSDNDGGTWGGAQRPQAPENSNQWNGPPQQAKQNWESGNNNTSNNWQGAQRNERSNTWGSNSSGENNPSSWGSNTSQPPPSQPPLRPPPTQLPPPPTQPPPTQPPPPPSDNMWAGTSKDNVWDRNGTSAWGDPGHRPPQPPAAQPSAAAMETVGSWESNRRKSWDEGPPQAQPAGWGSGPPGEPPAPRTDIDDGTTYWGDPSSQRGQPPAGWKGGPPPQPGNPHLPQPIIAQRPKPDDPQPWGPNAMPSNKWPDAAPPRVDEGTSSWIQSQQQQKPPAGPFGDGPWPPNNKPRPPSMNDWVETGEWNPAAAAKKLQLANYGAKPHHNQMRSQLLQQLTDMGFKKEDSQDALIRCNMNLVDAIAFLAAGASGNKRPDDLSDMQKGRQLRGGGGEEMGDRGIDPMMPPMNAPFPNAQGHNMPNPQMIANQLKQQQVPGAPSNLGNLTLAQQQRLLQTQQMAGGGKPQQPVLPQGQPPNRAAPQPPQTAASQPLQQHVLQQQQQQIAQQLQNAVSAGLISPQLLNPQQLTPTILVMLQHLLQLQQVFQQLNQEQQQLVLQKQRGNPRQINVGQKLDQLTVSMQRVRQEIQLQQNQIKQAQLAKQQTTVTPPAAATAMPPTADNTNKDVLKDLPSELNNMSVKEPAPGQSRLIQWKLPSPEKDAAANANQPGDGSNINKAPGSTLIHESHSTPNLQAKFESVNTSPFPDATWSSGGVSNGSSLWPLTSAISTAATTITSQMSSEGPSSERTSESQLSLTVAASTTSSSSSSAVVATISPSSSSAPAVPISAPSTVSSTASTPSSTPTSSTGDGAGGGAIDSIEEFVPGKLWQGGTVKSSEDDPYLTPGNARNHLSINTVKDDYAMSTLAPGKTTASPTSASDASAWSSYSNFPSKSAAAPTSAGSNPPSGSRASWSTAVGGEPPTSLGSDLWGVPGGATAPRNTRPPPGLGSQSATKAANWQRSVSWAPGDSTSNYATMGSRSNWSGQPGTATWLILKNIPPQIDSGTLKTICQQHGPLKTFQMNQQYGQALIRYNSQDEALKAQKLLNTCALGNQSIQAESVSDADVARLIEQTQQAAGAGAGGASTGPVSNLWGGGGGGPQSAGIRSAPPPFGGAAGGVASKTADMGQWNGSTSIGSIGSSMWGGSGLWSAQKIDEQPSSLLPGDLL